MPKDKTGFQIGDKVISQETKEEGTVSRLSQNPPSSLLSGPETIDRKWSQPRI